MELKEVIKECVILKQKGMTYSEIKKKLRFEYRCTEDEISTIISRVDDEVLYMQTYKTQKSKVINIQIIGVLLFVASIVLSIGSITINNSPVYILAYGPMGFGLTMIISGVHKLRMLKKYD